MTAPESDSTLQTRYWFAAKRYGWGWGLPIAWQGWVVLGVWIATVSIMAIGLAARHYAIFLSMMLVMAGILIGICYAKGEPPKWRWGK